MAISTLFTLTRFVRKNMLGKYMINHIYQYNNGFVGRGGGGQNFKN
jgi:hypothetical protein